MNKERLLNIKEAADFLGKTRNQIEDLVRDGRLEAYQIGGMYLRFKPEQLQGFKEKPHLLQASQEGKVSLYRSLSLIDNAKDFLYFNDFYILAIVAITVLLFIIIKSIS